MQRFHQTQQCTWARFPSAAGRFLSPVADSLPGDSPATGKALRAFDAGQTCRRLSRRFTLIELLIVITIISILAALLLSVLILAVGTYIAVVSR